MLAFHGWTLTPSKVEAGLRLAFEELGEVGAMSLIAGSIVEVGRRLAECAYGFVQLQFVAIGDWRFLLEQLLERRLAKLDRAAFKYALPVQFLKLEGDAVLAFDSLFVLVLLLVVVVEADGLFLVRLLPLLLLLFLLFFYLFRHHLLFVVHQRRVEEVEFLLVYRGRVRKLSLYCRCSEVLLHIPFYFIFELLLFFFQYS